MKFFNRDNEHLKLRKSTASLTALNKATSNGTSGDNCHYGSDVECGPSGTSASVSSSTVPASSTGSYPDITKDPSSSFDRIPYDFSQPSEFSPLSSWIIQVVTPELPSTCIIPTNKKDLALADPCCTYNQSVCTAMVRISLALGVLIGLPFSIWDAYPDFGVSTVVRHIEIVWSSLLHISPWPIALMTVMALASFPRGGMPVPNCLVRLANCVLRRTSKASTIQQPFIITSHWKISLILSIALSCLVIVQLMLQMGYPLLLWNPFMWGWYTVYYPQHISDAFTGACLQRQDKYARAPLCLEEGQWKELSSGMLSSHNPEDVLTVQRGLDYLQHESNGLLINALARNIADSVPALRDNVEGLLPLYGNDSKEKLSIVVFENDSDDGTRDEIKKWAKEEKEGRNRYTVDLISCGESNPDCKLGVMDRYDNMPYFSNPNASGVGKLGEFRQIVLDYIMKSDKYKDFSHMLVLDVDLGTSISPLGLLHTLGLENEIAQTHVVATSSSQVWPGTFGTIIPPYDLSAFRPKPTKYNSKIREMHQKFCELQPAGDRWRNMCEACSPMQLFMIQAAEDVTYNGGRPYQVTSAFNGLTLYPLDLIRRRGDKAHYDAGDDGQRCEHVGFHLSLKDTMYVNPKWTMNLKPSKPGGPTGLRAIKTLLYAVFGRPAVMLSIIFGNLIFFFVFVSSIWMIGVSVQSLFMLSAMNTSSYRDRMILGADLSDYGHRKGISMTE